MSLYLVLVLLFFVNVLGLERKKCDPGHNDCVAGPEKEHVYQTFVEGIPGVPPSDPLLLDEILVNLRSINYTLKNPTLIGLGKCNFLKLILAAKEESVTYKLLCPHLIIRSKYIVNGLIDGVIVTGQSSCEITYDDYFIVIYGKYERIMGENKKLQFHILHYDAKLDSHAIASARYQDLAVRDGNVYQYARKLEKLTRNHVMQKFIEKYMINLKNFQNIAPAENLHFKYV